MFIKNPEAITGIYQHIFLSPHFDDAIYSCGGYLATLAQSGAKSLVITIFAGIPHKEIEMSSLARKIHAKMGQESRQKIEALVERRRQEDTAAFKYLNIDYMWLKYTDAIYRGNPAYYTKNQDIKGEVHKEDIQLKQKIVQDLLIVHDKTSFPIWYLPLGMGHHVDHRIVCSVASDLMRYTTKIKFYEDFPYARKEGRLEARLKEFPWELQPELIDISQTYSKKQYASEIYASQIAINFTDKLTLYRDIASYAQKLSLVENTYMERYWTII